MAWVEEPFGLILFPRKRCRHVRKLLADLDNGPLTGFLRQLAQIKRRRREIASNGTTPTERADFSTAFSLFLYASVSRGQSVR